MGHDPWRRYRLHPDHRAAGFLTLDALVAARDPHFFPELGLEPHRPDALLLFEADLPNHVEDASGFESQKVEALLCHHSQFESTMGIPSDDPARRSARCIPRTGAADAPAGTEPATADGYAAFAAKVRHQLMSHGSLADLASGEAFHRITGAVDRSAARGRPAPHRAAGRQPGGRRARLGPGRSTRVGSATDPRHQGPEGP